MNGAGPVVISARLRAEIEHRTAVAPDSLVAAFALPRSPQSAGVARGHVRAALVAASLPDLTDDAALITSELVGNAMQHADSPVDVALITAHGVLVILVADSSRLPPVVGAAGDWTESGRGLVIVDAIADRWGHWPTNAGKTVWACLSLTVPGSAATVCGGWVSPRQRGL
jgi:serine/threonine-protein kinase RsbW